MLAIMEYYSWKDTHTMLYHMINVQFDKTIGDVLSCDSCDLTIA